MDTQSTSFRQQILPPPAQDAVDHRGREIQALYGWTYGPERRELARDALLRSIGMVGKLAVDVSTLFNAADSAENYCDCEAHGLVVVGGRLGSFDGR